MTYYIYILQNTINLKIYVGQTNNLKKREREHRAKDRIKTKNSPLYQAIKKYGFDKFKMIPIESFDSISEVDDAEIFWIQFFQSRNREFGYNLAEGGCVNRGFKHSDKWKKEQSKRKKELFKNKLSNMAKLTMNEVKEIRSLFIKENISYRKLANMYNTNRITIKRIINNLIYKDDNYAPPPNMIDFHKKSFSKYKYTIKIIDENGNLFDSIKEAAAHYNVSSDTIKYRLTHSNIKERKRTLKLPKFYYI